jgi:hypothetical protein
MMKEMRQMIDVVLITSGFLKERGTDFFAQDLLRVDTVKFRELILLKASFLYLMM